MPVLTGDTILEKVDPMVKGTQLFFINLGFGKTGFAVFIAIFKQIIHALS